MAGSRRHLLIEVGPLGMAALACNVRNGGDAPGGSGSITGLKAISAQRPGDLDWSDAVAVGKWVRSILLEHGVRTRQATLVVGRGDVVQRRLTMAAVGLRSGELPGAVRLQMLRSLALAAEDSAVDYLVENEGTGEGAALAVSAAALPGSRVAWLRQFAASAGLRVRALRLRTHGVASLLGRASHRTAGAVIGLCSGAGGVELLVVDEGRVLYSRALEFDDSADSQDQAARLAAETRRTWTAYRTTPEGRDADEIAVLGGSEASHTLARVCGESLGLPARTLSEDEVLAGLRNEQTDPRGWAVPLAGVLKRELSGADDIDFANPRRPEKPRSRLAIVAGVAAAVIVLAMAGQTFRGVRDLRAARVHVEELREQLVDLRAREAASIRDGARLDHSSHWLATNVAWLEHLSTVGSMLPAARNAVLDSIVAAARPRIEYVKGKSRAYDADRWHSAVAVDISITGRTSSRTVAEELRAMFVKDARYSVSPVGDDAPAASGSRYPEAFAMKLTTALGRIPSDADPEIEAPSQPVPSTGGES